MNNFFNIAFSIVLVIGVAVIASCTTQLYLVLSQ
jgi:hypothetical protein